MSEPRITETTRAAMEASASAMPFHDTQDFDDARRGRIARATERKITADDGRVVWDLDAYAFLESEPPETVHPSLWRQSQLNVEDGLFEVVPGVYQLRGFDISVMSVLETDEGVVVVDPLVSRETAAAAFGLYVEHRGSRPVKAVIYTHSHADHFGGVKGVVTEEQVLSGSVAVIAPEGFMEAAISENVFAGPAMARRAQYMYGSGLPKGSDGQVGSGLGQGLSSGTIGLIRPTVDISTTGQELEIDGLRLVFQITPGTEAPAEMNFYLPQHKALCTAENTSHTLHNILTIRGAQVRDAHGWARYLTETIALFGDELELVFASHHWPTWGRERAVEFLSMQRDLYLYLHDQTLRLLNTGLNGAEIAEQLELPPALEAAWHTHGYYGSVSHNVKAVYQRYMGWYDANPANLWPHPPEQLAERYVAAMGGPEAALEIAGTAFASGDYRWAMEVAKHLVFAGHGSSGASALLADAMEQVGFGTENATWRNAMLTGAKELRDGAELPPPGNGPIELLSALSISQLLDAMATRVNGPRAFDEELRIALEDTDDGATYLAELRHGVLHHRRVDAAPSGCTVVSGPRSNLVLFSLGLVIGLFTVESAVESGTIALVGDGGLLDRLVGLIDPPTGSFPIVTP